MCAIGKFLSICQALYKELWTEIWQNQSWTSRSLGCRGEMGVNKNNYSSRYGLCIRSYSFLPQHLLSHLILEIDPSSYLRTWFPWITSSISQLALLLGMFSGDINGNVPCGLPRGVLKESYPSRKCGVLHTCFSSFFWPKTPAAIMKHKVKLNLEVKCRCGGEIGT